MFESGSFAADAAASVALLRAMDGRSEIELALCAVLLRPAAAAQELVVVHGPLAGWDVDPGSVTPAAAVDALVAVQAQVARLQAQEAALLVRAAGATRVVRDVLVEDVDPATGLPCGERDPRVVPLVDEVVEEIAAALHRSPDQVRGQVHTARLLHGPLHRTWDALAAGRITGAHATAIAEQATRLLASPLGTDPDADLVFAKACSDLQDRVLPHVANETVTECRGRARRVVVSIDPEGAAARRRRAKLHCDVAGKALDDGLALIEAVLPVLDAQTILATVDATARTAISTGSVEEFGLGDDATLGQVRAAVFTRLLRDGHAGGSGTDSGRVRVEVGVLVDAATLGGITPNGPVSVTIGGQPTDASREDLLALLTDPAVHASFRRLVTDPLTGALVDRGANTYQASSSLRAWLQARDVTCTHPGCTRPAARCDVDHTVDFHAGGRTTRANTKLRCRRHHNAKTFSGWRIENAQPDGSCEFVSPAGRRYRHDPVRLMPEPPPPPPPATTPPDLEPPPF